MNLAGQPDRRAKVGIIVDRLDDDRLWRVFHLGRHDAYAHKLHDGEHCILAVAFDMTVERQKTRLSENAP